MSTILVVDDMAMCREPIAEALRIHGHDVICAAGGTEALRALRDHQIGVVLLDVTMPEPDGLTVLRTMRRNPDHAEIPVVMMTDRAEKDIVTQAAKCGVQGYLLKSNFSLDILLERVNTCIAKSDPAKMGASGPVTKNAPKSPSDTRPPPVATAVSGTASKQSAPANLDTPTADSASPPSITSLRDLVPVITREKLTSLINDGLTLKPLSATVHNVIAVTKSNGCSAADVAKAVSKDQALCIRLLRLANSSAYSRGRPVDGVQTAVQRIGIQEVQKLVMTLGVFDQYGGSQSTRIDMHLFWEHSIACGLIAAALARECQFKGVDDCFLWGTVHDVGRVILLEHLPEEYAKVCAAADALMFPMEVVEPRLLRLGHGEVLKHALAHWQFPQAFIVPVVNHHEAVNRLKRLGTEHAQPAMIVALANRVAHALLLGCSGNETVYPFDDLVESLEISPAAIEKIADGIPDETRDLKFTMLAHSAGETWPDFTSTVRARFDMPIRPLCVSGEPATDAFGLFLNRVADCDESGPPNLGVISLRKPAEAAALFAEYQGREAEVGCEPLPLIVVCGCDADKLVDVPWESRPHALLKMPVAIALLVKAVHGLLAQVVEA